MSSKIEHRYGRLKVIKEIEPLTRFYGKKKNKRKIRLILCECICGNETAVRLENLSSGHTISCGCYMKDQIKKFNTRHGLSNTALNQCYNNMINRCYNKNVDRYKDCGDRGIKVCKSWRDDKKEFFKWALDNGYKEGLELDREYNNRNYTPSNCRFVKTLVNANNKRNNLYFTIDGEKMTLAQLCRKYKVKYSTAYYRIQKGNPIQNALGLKSI